MADIGVSGDERRRSVRPLRALFPYVMQYRKLAVGAIISLIVAAGTTLALPMAVRRMIDHGFQAAGTTFIAEYFAALVLMAAVLAAASASRYYLVITLGERVVADIRRDVFSHVTTLSPAFFDRSQSG
ncbi:ABC transporter, partial [Mesorhizobium sp. M1A.F.Ca.IN.022.05.2.1]